jgi:hypothetical protein
MTPKKKGHHVSKTIWQLRRKRSMIVKEPPVAFLPRIRLSTPELLAKVFTNERMGIEDYADLLPRGVSLSSVWKELFATR